MLFYLCKKTSFLAVNVRQTFPRCFVEEHEYQILSYAFAILYVTIYWFILVNIFFHQFHQQTFFLPTFSTNIFSTFVATNIFVILLLTSGPAFPQLCLLFAGVIQPHGTSPSGSPQWVQTLGVVLSGDTLGFMPGHLLSNPHIIVFNPGALLGSENVVQTK